MEENGGNTSSQLTQTLSTLVAATNDLRCVKDELYPTVLRTGLDKGITFTAIYCQILTFITILVLTQVFCEIAFLTRFVWSASTE